MRNIWRKTLVTVGIAVALMVGPGIGMASAAPLQIQPTQFEIPELQIEELVDPISELLEPILESLFPEPQEPPD